MGIFLGLLAALAWGFADFCARFAAHKVGFWRAGMYMQPIGLFLLTVFMLINRPPYGWDWGWFWLAVLLGMFNVAAGLSLYRAFEIGQLSLVAPIASSYGGVTLVLALLSGQRPGLLALGGLVVIIIGVVLASADVSELFKSGKTGEKIRPRGVGLAIFAAFGFGIAFWGLGFVTPVLGYALPTWELRLVGFLSLLMLAKPFRQSISPPKGAAWGWIIAVGVLDTAAFVLYQLGLLSAESGIVAVVTSLFSVVTVILARIFLKERLAPVQGLGILTILVGIALVGTT
jgi:drug/metabolite transporter (DMT)-like permease